jgi:glycosyltransferase involved in cell wall biosynthesis
VRILHVIPSVSDRSGGPAQAIFPMCRALLTRGLDVTITTTNHGESDQFANDSLVSTNGNKNGQLNTARSYRGVSTYFFPVQWGDGFKYSRPLAAWLNANVKSFDVVHIHAVFNHACIAAARACRKQGVPYVIRPLGTLDPWSMKQKPLRKKLFWALEGKKMLHEAGAIHYTAQAERSAAERLLGLRRGKVVPLGIDGSDLPVHNQTSAGPFGEPNPYVLVLSRLHPKKGLDILIEAFLDLRKRERFSEWRLVIAGDGDEDYLDSLKQMVTDMGGNEFVIFRGWLEGQEKNSVLSNASLLTLPSRQENFGLCVLEALSRGVPVIVSPEVNLAKDIDTARAGWISAVDVSALVKCLAEALSNEEERIKRGCAGKSFSRNFEWNKIAEGLESMYVSVVATHLP